MSKLQWKWASCGARTGLWACVALACWLQIGVQAATNDLTRPDHHFLYTNDVIDEVPWSIHVVKLERAYHDFEFCTTLGLGSTFGMSTVSEQLKWLTQDSKVPLSAINGDFSEKGDKYNGRPRYIR